MSAIIFIIVLGILIFVHELGHFLVAKWAKIRVDEFAIGFPPRLFSFTKGETRYALNLIPFGGYVKIFGETPDEESLKEDATNSFVNKSKWIQAGVLVAGVTFNILFAWFLFSVSFMSGFPSIVTDDNQQQVSEAAVVITSVSANSPANQAGLMVGDRITMLEVAEKAVLGNPTVEGVQKFIAAHESEEVTVFVTRKGETLPIIVTPEAASEDGRPVIGVALNLIGSIKLGFFDAIAKGGETVLTMMKEIAIGLFGFLGNMFVGKAQLDQVSGPIGIVGLVGDASQFGFVYLLGFTAFISLNLAVLNLVPFPALDGGRLLFVLIEGVTRRQIKPSIANMLNVVGFGLLILLMIVITVSDIIKLF